MLRIGGRVKRRRMGGGMFGVKAANGATSRSKPVAAFE